MEVAATIGASFTNLRVTNGFRRKARIIEREFDWGREGAKTVEVGQVNGNYGRRWSTTARTLGFGNRRGKKRRQCEWSEGFSDRVHWRDSTGMCVCAGISGCKVKVFSPYCGMSAFVCVLLWICFLFFFFSWVSLRGTHCWADYAFEAFWKGNICSVISQLWGNARVSVDAGTSYRCYLMNDLATVSLINISSCLYYQCNALHTACLNTCLYFT